jgi:hypothetical protein
MSAVLEPKPSAAARDSVRNLLRRLSAADGILQREKGARLVLRLWWLPCAAVLAMIAVDAVWHLAGAARMALDLGLAGLIFGVVAAGAWLCWGKRNAAEHTARVLEARSPALGSKLINCLQLDAQANDPRLEPFTRELAGAAVEEAAARIDTGRLDTLARTDTVRRESRRTGKGLLAFAGLLLLCWPLTRTEAPRFFDPFGDHPPFSFTRIEIDSPADDTIEVIYGQPILVGARVGGHRPGELFLTYHPAGQPAQAVTVPMFDKGDRGFSQQIDAVKAELVVFAHTKNRHSISKQRRIGVSLTPKLDKAFVKITPPAYTALPPEEKPLQFKPLKALAGSRLEFRLLSNRPLTSGRIELIKSPQETAEVPLVSTGGNEVSGGFEAQDAVRLRFSMTDLEGHPSQETWETSLTVTNDLAPEIEIRNPPGDSFVAEDFVVDLLIEAGDDYGLATMRIHQAHNEEWGEPEVIRYEKPDRNARAERRLDLKALGYKPGDTISIFAEAIDTYPDPHLTRSKTVTLAIISTEDYNNFLRERTDMADIQEKFAQLAEQLRELAEQQKQLGEQAEKAEEALEKAADAKAKEAAQAKLDALQQKQNELNAKLNKLADTMDDFVRKDPIYDVEADMQKVLDQQAEAIRQSTQANQQAQDQIAQRTSPPQGGRQMDQQMLADFKKASDEQMKNLGGVEKQQEEQIDQPLADMALLHEIMKDLNRMRDLNEAQKQLAQQAKAYDRKGELSREDQLALKDLAATQNAIGEQLQAVQERLREDGKAAMEKFPKAGQSAQDLAEKMGDMRLAAMAGQSTQAMLSGQGENGAQLSQQLSNDIDGLFCEACKNPGNQPGELDQYLKLTRGMSPGQNFKQMMQSRKFGQGGKPGFGKGEQGFGGSDGYAMTSGPETPVLGNETRISRDSDKSSSKTGQSQARAPRSNPEVALDKPDVVQGVNPLNRESDAVQGETPVDQYRELVERYFKAITK